MKNRTRLRQVSILIGIVVVLTVMLFASALTTEEAMAQSDSPGGLAGCIACTFIAPIVCTSYCMACACDECTYFVTCGNCDGGCGMGCHDRCVDCGDRCVDCVGCAGT